MAARYPTPPQAADPLATQINTAIDGILAKMMKLRMDFPAETQFNEQCDTRDLEVSISRLGEIVPVVLPKYATFHLPTVATGKEGSAPGEFNTPCAVAINEATKQIFVANFHNHRIEIFSETGEYLNQLSDGQLATPWGIAIHGNSLYVSSFISDSISKYTLTDFSLVKRVRRMGSNNGEFNCPLQLTTDPSGCVFIADSDNDRICVLDTELNHQRNITHQAISEPSDVIVSHDRIYVLCPRNNPCMLVLSLEGDMLHSLIRGEGMDVLNPWFFCLDANSNLFISDEGTHSIRVFSPAGDLLHSIGREGHQQGMFYKPQGIAIDTNGRLVCVSCNKNFGLQIFS